MAETWDVFISYAHADQDWVRRLATNLHNLGLEVFRDEWEIGSADVLVHRLDEGLLHSRAGVLVVSPPALASPWVRAEYAAMMNRAVAGQQRLIPVLLADTAMPPFLASRLYIDFRHADGLVYTERVQELARTLRGERPGPPPRPDQVQPPPGTGFRAEGPLHYRLQIDRHTVQWLGGPEAVQQPARALDPTLEQRLWELEQARHRASPDDPILLRGPGGDGLDALLEQIGDHLGRAFLAGPVAEALSVAVAEATRLNCPLVLGIDIRDDTLAALPWETLRLPDQPGPALALHPRMELYRLLSTPGPTPSLAIPGPLRLLVAIGSPEAQNARGELLDMEAELSRILDAVEPARRAGRGAVVQVLETGSLRAIREALEQRRYHVLYLSCHAAPGELLLEDEDGQEVRVSAQRLCTEALAAGRGVPLVVLAGCSTGREGQASATEARPGVAQALVAHGVPAVLAMQAPVTDHYATALGAALFHALATWEAPLPLRALAAARRQLEYERQQADPAPRPPPEWATPTLYAAVEPLPLYDPAAPFERLPDRPAPHLDPGVAVRRVGEFVGRRREQRVLLRALRGQEHAGVLLHGIGGVGKSTLAAQLLHRLVEEGWWLVSVVGEITPDDILEAVGKRLLARCVEEGRSDNDPWRRLAAEVRRPDVDWEERLELLSTNLLEQVPLVLLLDNLEDNLDAQQHWKNPQLADCLRRWLRAPGRSRLLVTCRYSVVLPQHVERRLLAWHVGPLSLAETRKLLWRFPGLNALSPTDQRRAYADVGGHPRALEYLDALLRGGRTPFHNVAERLETALERRGIARPDTWMQGVTGDLDRALAETVTLAADDVLLDHLLDRLAAAPLAHALLLGAAVYRVPVDEVGLSWQVGEERKPEPDPARAQRLAVLQEALTQARERGEQPTLETLGLTPEARRQVASDLEEQRRPPIQAPDDCANALALLQDLTLLSPVQLTDDDLLRYTVHRWTAAALARRTAPDTLRQAHHRAARYWRWRVATVPQSRAQDIEELLEARYHHHQAGEIDAAVEATEWVCSQLDTWGAWRREEQLCRETLTWVPERSTRAAAFLGQLGIIAQARGAYDEALEWYRRSLALNEELGDRAGMASSYGQIGVLFTIRGMPDAAVAWNLRSLLICAELRSPQIRINLHWLTQQRQMLGETRFLNLLHEQLNEDETQALLRWLDDFASRAQDNAVETAPEEQGAHAEELGGRASVASLETLPAPLPELPPEA